MALREVLARFAFIALIAVAPLGSGCATGDATTQTPGDDAATGDDAAGDDAADATSTDGMCTKLVCGTSCADTKTDPNNCGGCGVVCKVNHTCTNGACVLACGAGTVACVPADKCVNTGSCCTNADCTVTNATCPTPGGVCSCPTGTTFCSAN